MNNTTHCHQEREFLSALTDGEISSDELGILFSAGEHRSPVRADWAAYQLIGDVLRSPGGSALLADCDFLEKINQRLALETTQITSFVPIQRAADKVEIVAVPSGVYVRGKASNDGNFRWKLLAGFASLAAVSAVGFNVLGFMAPVDAPQLAQAHEPPLQRVLVASPQGPMLRDARLEELLTAHRQMGATSALQVPSGFLRNATFEAAQSAAR